MSGCPKVITTVIMCCSRKYPYLSHKGILVLTPHPHPSGNSSFASYFLLKTLAFETPLPSPLEISSYPPWGWGLVWIFSGTAQ